MKGLGRMTRRDDMGRKIITYNIFEKPYENQLTTVSMSVCVCMCVCVCVSLVHDQILSVRTHKGQ